MHWGAGRECMGSGASRGLGCQGTLRASRDVGKSGSGRGVGVSGGVGGQQGCQGCIGGWQGV